MAVRVGKVTRVAAPEDIVRGLNQRATRRYGLHPIQTRCKSVTLSEVTQSRGIMVPASSDGLYPIKI
jgi:hypothetical protein